ncbi:hypothetical protein [Roseibium sp. SCP14]|uniref:hypothetical protein n=1 Tax=Roseibium sp. SCP14 TaxID=3141375 RepID=UPI0033396C00
MSSRVLTPGSTGSPVGGPLPVYRFVRSRSHGIRAVQAQQALNMRSVGAKDFNVVAVPHTAGNNSLSAIQDRSLAFTRVETVDVKRANGLQRGCRPVTFDPQGDVPGTDVDQGMGKDEQIN